MPHAIAIKHTAVNVPDSLNASSPRAIICICIPVMSTRAG